MGERKLLTEIMSSYVQRNEKMPVEPIEPPVRPSQFRWELTEDKVLRKTFVFVSLDERNAFLYTHLQQDGQHASRHCRTTIDGMNVVVELGTKGLLIDLDKDRARMIDSLWRDVIRCIGARNA